MSYLSCELDVKQDVFSSINQGILDLAGTSTSEVILVISLFRERDLSFLQHLCKVGPAGLA